MAGPFGFLSNKGTPTPDNSGNNTSGDDNNSPANQPNNQGNTQGNMGDNNNNNNDTVSSIWDTNNEPSNTNNQQQQNNQQQPPNNNGKSAQEVFNEHVKSLNLAGNLNMEGIQEAFRNQDFEGFQQNFQQTLSDVAANTYKAALQQMNQLADKKIDAAIEKAVAESSETVNQNMAVNKMKTDLPFVNDPDIEPVASAALQQFLSKNVPMDEAIKKVGEFFNSTAQKIADSYGGNAPGSGNYNPNNPPNNNRQSNQNQGQDEDWMQFLTQ